MNILEYKNDPADVWAQFERISSRMYEVNLKLPQRVLPTPQTSKLTISFALKTIDNLQEIEKEDKSKPVMTHDEESELRRVIEGISAVLAQDSISRGETYE